MDAGEGLGEAKEKREMVTPSGRRRGCEDKMNVIVGQAKVKGLCESAKKIMLASRLHLADGM